MYPTAQLRAFGPFAEGNAELDGGNRHPSPMSLAIRPMAFYAVDIVVR